VLGGRHCLAGGGCALAHGLGWAARGRAGGRSEQVRLRSRRTRRTRAGSLTRTALPSANHNNNNTNCNNNNPSHNPSCAALLRSRVKTAPSPPAPSTAPAPSSSRSIGIMGQPSILAACFACATTTPLGCIYCSGCFLALTARFLLPSATTSPSSSWLDVWGCRRAGRACWSRACPPRRSATWRSQVCACVRVGLCVLVGCVNLQCRHAQANAATTLHVPCPRSDPPLPHPATQCDRFPSHVPQLRVSALPLLRRGGHSCVPFPAAAGYPNDLPAGSCITTQCAVSQEVCSEAYLYHRCDTASGQSGSPMW
jgi:hypothetical protein